ncbi:MAG: hypothetical protein HYU39_00350 [Thaumarchaeota archaeon]|nr:hypothetical protein [Nitrososphaerota archaeon]
MSKPVVDTEHTKRIPKPIRNYLLEEFNGKFSESHKLMAQYNMPMLEGFAKFRRSIQPPKGDHQGALPKHIKELISVVIEVTLGKGGGHEGPGVSHMRHAVRVGATPEMAHEAMALVFFLAGMTSYVSYGINVVRAAEDEYAKLQAARNKQATKKSK